MTNVENMRFHLKVMDENSTHAIFKSFGAAVQYRHDYCDGKGIIQIFDGTKPAGCSVFKTLLCATTYGVC